MYKHTTLLFVATVVFSFALTIPTPQFRRWGEINGAFYPSNGGNGGYFPGNGGNGGYFPGNGGNGGYFPGNGGNGGYFPGNNGGYYPGYSSGTGRRPHYYGGKIKSYDSLILMFREIFQCIDLMLHWFLLILAGGYRFGRFGR